MSLAETIKNIETHIKEDSEKTAEVLTLVPNEFSKIEGEEIMLYVQEMRRISWEIAGNYL